MTYHIDRFMTDDPERRVLPFRPRTEDLETTIHEIAKVDRYVYMGAHAKERLLDRGFTRVDAVRVLCRGHIDGPIEPGNSPGEWKCKVVARLKGSRDIGVVTIVIEGKKLFIKTVEWEDLK